MAFSLSRTRRLSLVIGISTAFFLVEISVGFYTRSLALIADAFHYLNDIIGFAVALTALRISRKKDSPKELSFGWQRAQLLGSFFNGVFLLALGVSIFLQSIDRFVSLEKVQNPELMLIVGCVGLALNLTSATFLHEHDHAMDALRPESIELQAQAASSTVEAFSAHTSHRHGRREPIKTGYDFGVLAVLIHVLGDAANNLGVIIAAAVIWRAEYAARYYADPAASMAISVMILLTSLPLVKKSGLILLESVPTGVDLSDVQHDLEAVPGVQSVHELHAWRLNQQKSLASVHIAVTDCLVSDFIKLANTLNECFHSYGIHSATVQPELAVPDDDGDDISAVAQGYSGAALMACQINCGSVCERWTCCGGF